MHTTSASLLEQLRQPADGQPAAVAWDRFVKLYTPLIYHWARRVGLQDSDAADLVQDVLAALVQKLPAFSYDPGRGFRAWLHVVVLNKWRDRLRRPALPTGADDGPLADVAAPREFNDFEEREYRQYLINRALRLMQAEFSAATWKACWEHVVVGRPAADVAAELGICVGTVYVAKTRVLARLRQELQGLLE